MAVQPGPTDKRYAANGVSLIYTVPFLVIEAGDLQVLLNGEQLTSGFTHVGVGLPISYIEFTIPPTGDLLLQLSVPFQRLVDYQENGDFLSSTVNRDFDRIWQALKQLLRTTSRSPVLGANDIDGQGFYRAKGNGLVDLASAAGNPTAAANWKDVLDYVASILETGQGPVNNASNVLYVSSSGVAVTVQDMSDHTDPSLGAGVIGRAIRHINNLFELRSIVGSYDLETILLLQGADTGPGTGYLYHWSASSVASDTGNTVVKPTAATTGRWLRMNKNNTVRLDTDFGLTPNDSAVDNGPLLNTVLTAAAASRVSIDGGGATFYTRTTIKPESYLHLYRAIFMSMGAPAGDTSAKAHIPVIDINGTSSLKTGLYFEEVFVDGQRPLWPNVSMSTAGPEGGGSEDGGMHAWRISGRVESSAWKRCKGNNSASAGWAIHNPTPAGSLAFYSHIDLTFEDCEGVGNREHGMFADSFDNIKWIRGKLKGNGTDLNTTDALTHGNRGARNINGKLFGGPFDLETYPPLMGSLFTNFLMQSTDCRGNAVGALMYNPIATNLAGYIIPRNIRLIDCDIDTGVSSNANRAPEMINMGLLISGNKVTEQSFASVNIASRVSGRIGANFVTKLDTSGSYIETDGVKVEINTCDYYDVSGPSLTANVSVFPAPIVTLARTSGAAGLAAALSLQSIHGAKNCGLHLNYSVTITGATGSGVAGTFSVTPPAGFHLETIEFSVFVTATGFPISASSAVAGSGNTGTLYIDSSANTTLTGALRVGLVPDL